MIRRTWVRIAMSVLLLLHVGGAVICCLCIYSDIAEIHSHLRTSIVIVFIGKGKAYTCSRPATLTFWQKCDRTK